MHSRRSGDAGQAFPIYITVAAGLLFLALAYLAVGQAAVNRSGAQTAADAAVLAAAQKTRDQLADLWVHDVLDPAKWQDIFDGHGAGDSCARAYQLAAQNSAQVEHCWHHTLSYDVAVRTNKKVGHSVVPGTEDFQSTASARAVIEPLCEFKLPAAHAGHDKLPRLNCKDRQWDLKPEDLTELPRPEDLFDVHLAADR
ncbi:pilus assembly protein TadG-related protein [Streptomyces sp. NK08204]|uniref:pilus assembly protein TadG-related protein n=1 Tax=Streptomyces sp. NK08204 TaxID=2873260 RepID=UPI0035A92B6C